MKSYRDLTVADLGPEATYPMLERFVLACEKVEDEFAELFIYGDDLGVDEASVAEYVWHNGRFDVMIKLILGEEAIVF